MKKNQHWRRGKKAQFYILAAILLSAHVLFLAKASPPIVPGSSFEGLYSNYLSEAPKAVNSAFYNNSNANVTLRAFSDSFYGYARGLDPSFRFAYFYGDGRQLHGVSYFDESITLATNSTTTSFRGYVQVSDTRYADVTLGGKTYKFRFTGKEVHAVFRSSSKNQVLIHEG